MLWKRAVLAALLAAAMLAALWAGRRAETGGRAARDIPPLAMRAQGGSAWPVPDGADEDAWLARAQELANERGEAIAVTQGGKLIALVNPEAESHNGDPL